MFSLVSPGVLTMLAFEQIIIFFYRGFGDDDDSNKSTDELEEVQGGMTFD